MTNSSLPGRGRKRGRPEIFDHLLIYLLVEQLRAKHPRSSVRSLLADREHKLSRLVMPAQSEWEYKLDSKTGKKRLAAGPYRLRPLSSETVRRRYNEAAKNGVWAPPIPGIEHEGGDPLAKEIELAFQFLGDAPAA